MSVHIIIENCPLLPPPLSHLLYTLYHWIVRLLHFIKTALWRSPGFPIFILCLTCQLVCNFNTFKISSFSFWKSLLVFLPPLWFPFSSKSFGRASFWTWWIRIWICQDYIITFLISPSLHLQPLPWLNLLLQIYFFFPDPLYESLISIKLTYIL